MAHPERGSIRDNFRVTGVLPNPSDSSVTQFPLTALALGNPGYFNTVRAIAEGQHRDVYSMKLQEIEELIRETEQKTLKDIGAWHFMSSPSGYDQCDTFKAAINTPLPGVQPAVPAGDSVVVPDEDERIPFGAFVDGSIQLLAREDRKLTEQEHRDFRKKITPTVRMLRELILQWLQAGTDLPLLRKKLSQLLLENRKSRPADELQSEASVKIDKLALQVWAMVAKVDQRMANKPTLGELELIRIAVTKMIECDG